jgi:hypothetical protein
MFLNFVACADVAKLAATIPAPASDANLQIDLGTALSSSLWRWRKEAAFLHGAVNGL